MKLNLELVSLRKYGYRNSKEIIVELIGELNTVENRLREIIRSGGYDETDIKDLILFEHDMQRWSRTIRELYREMNKSLIFVEKGGKL